MAVEAVLLDTNVLLTATTPSRQHHRAAWSVFSEWPGRGVSLLASGQIMREYLVVATRSREVNGLGLELEEALANVAQLRSRVALLDERVAVFEHLSQLVDEVGCRGKQIHDANLVATALAHGTGYLLTGNVKDFQRFSPYVEILDLANMGSEPPQELLPGNGDTVQESGE